MLTTQEAVGQPSSLQTVAAEVARPRYLEQEEAAHSHRPPIVVVVIAVGLQLLVAGNTGSRLYSSDSLRKLRKGRRRVGWHSTEPTGPHSR